MHSMNHRLRVLVADGSAFVRKRLCHLVQETAGLTLAGEAASAVEAYLLFVARQPDAVVIAAQMPDTSGLQVLRRIKEAAPECVVIVLCDEMTGDYHEICARFGADHLFHKSSEFEQAFAVLSRVAETRETGQRNRPRWLGGERQSQETLCVTTAERNP
jgi:DNA-binding NarL/FixJ family response regulator